jgi:hypothetical protein
VRLDGFLLDHPSRHLTRTTGGVADTRRARKVPWLLRGSSFRISRRCAALHGFFASLPIPYPHAAASYADSDARERIQSNCDDKHSSFGKGQVDSSILSCGTIFFANRQDRILTRGRLYWYILTGERTDAPAAGPIFVARWARMISYAITVLVTE